MIEKKKQELAEAMLLRTGPVLPLNAFNNHPELEAAQTVRNRLAMGEIPKHFFFKSGRKTLVDMRAYLLFWAEGLTPYVSTGQIGKK